MGTIINGNKWVGACVNGNVVSGLVKNGVVFYKKNQQELYKRRIMVGDNLKGKTIYPEFTTPSEDIFIDDRKRNMIIFNNNSNESIYLIQHSISEGLCQDIIASISNAEYIYRKNESNILKQNNITIFNDKDYFVTNIYHSVFSYRCLYIEDSNIRPLQIGDKIVKGTKLYFNFPDNLTNVEDKTIFSLDTMEDLHLKILSNKISISDRIGQFAPERTISTLSIEPTEEGGFTITKEIFNTEDSLNIINLSAYTYECYGYQEGIPVNEIDNELINYVLVDTTTLGN